MCTLEKAILREKERLAQEIGILKERQQQYPQGRLKINQKGKRTQFCMQMLQKENLEGVEKVKEKIIYIKKENPETVDKLVQRDYEKKLLKALEARYKVIKNVPKVYGETDLIRIYSESHPERKSRIKTEYLPDEEFAENWQNISYKGKPLGENVPEIYTVKGERVRSKSEKILADLFERSKIPYRYEHPLELQNGNVIYPDFMLLNKRTRREYYFEHLGMMDDPQYAEKAIKRIALYERNDMYPGEKLLITSETRNTPLNTALVTQLIRHYLL
ncbi:MAG: hypothetical protein IJ121_10385 [Eubacterium sp.]|nr:hypothetical protein [Eubacterium sp.]